MTQEPDRESTEGGAPGEWEVLTGPGGPERERTSLRALWQPRSARGRTVTAATTVAVLALGGTVAYAASSGSDDSGSRAVPAAAGSAPASDAPEAPRGRHGGGPWAGLGGDAVHGEATVKDRDTGDWVVRIWQRGTVEKVDGDQVTVKSDDGTVWTWTVGKDATGRRDGTSDTLKKGETAYLVGSRSDAGTRTAVRARAGTDDKGSGDKGPGDWRGKRGHGPWGHNDRTPSPHPSGSGATT